MANENAALDTSDVTRVIVNSNLNTDNIASIDKELPTIEHTLERCAEILKSHCGPQSGYAMLVNNFKSGFEPNVFTRDGIRILSAVEMMSPLERYVKELLTYIGTKVDNNAKDGTTTSMLFSALFLKNMLMKHDVFKKSGLSFFQLDRAVKKAFKLFQDNLVKDTYTINRLCGCKPEEEVDEVRALNTAGKIAFMQALSSSGGNLELALAMKQIFEQSPRKSWEFITSHHSTKESGKEFQVEVDEYDTKLRCTLNSIKGLDKELNTKYEEENVLCFIYPEYLDDLSVKTDAIKEFLTNIPPTQPTVFIAQHMSATVVKVVNELNETREKPITLWQYAAEARLSGQSWPWELIILCAISGIEPFSMSTSDIITDANFFMAPRVKWEEQYMFFYDVVEKLPNTCLHPFYVDPDKATNFYKNTLKAAETKLNACLDGHNPDTKMTGIFTEILNKLTCIHRPLLRLGGPSHIQVANADVVQDVQGAIMSSLKHGFLISGPIAWYRATTAALSEANRFKSDNELNVKINRISTLILETCKSVIEEILETIYEGKISVENFSHDNYLNALFDDHTPLSMLEYVTKINQLKPDTDLDELGDLGMTYPVLQPIAITKELVVRTHELLMKFINTNKIVVFGGVVVEPENNQEKK